MTELNKHFTARTITTERKLSGGNIAGGNSRFGRVENDYYATPPSATKMFLDNHKLMIGEGGKILEPSCGEGHMSEVIAERFPNSVVVSKDIVDREYINFNGVEDFLESSDEEKYDLIMTNPPFNKAKEFVEKGVRKLNEGGSLVLFLKIQFLESEKRKRLFEEYPPKYVYVHSKRVNPWRNGKSVNPETGKKWASTMAFAWFVWEEGFTSEPVIRWL